MRKEMIQPKTMYKATTYTHVVKKNGIIFISGQVAKNAENQIVGKGDITAQAEQVFQNLKDCCEAAGATLRDVVKLTIYATNVAHYRPGITSVRDRLFSEAPPATTFVVVTSLSDPYLLLEVEAIAMVD